MKHRRLPVAEIARLYTEEQLSGEQIAERYGCNPKSVTTLLRRHGIPRRNPREAHAQARAVGRWQPTWTGRKLSREHRRRLARSGPRHPRWNGGIWMRPWRNLPKVRCESCDATSRLCNTHRNNDYTDWRIENRWVLCVTCHRRHRKQQFWRSVRAGEKPLAFNGPVGWRSQRERAA